VDIGLAEEQSTVQSFITPERNVS